MKIKRFDNIWIMGLILSGTILVVLYVVKLLFPSFIIETAQNEKICLIGNYIDTHEWAWFLSSTVLSFVSYYFLCWRMLQEDKTKFNRTWNNPCGDYYRTFNPKVFKFFLLYGNKLYFYDCIALRYESGIKTYGDRVLFGQYSSSFNS